LFSFAQNSAQLPSFARPLAPESGAFWTVSPLELRTEEDGDGSAEAPRTANATTHSTSAHDRDSIFHE
jgi:hypothetical protein